MIRQLTASEWFGEIPRLTAREWFGGSVRVTAREWFGGRLRLTAREWFGDKLRLTAREWFPIMRRVTGRERLDMILSSLRGEPPIGSHHSFVGHRSYCNRTPASRRPTAGCSGPSNG
jgi:hypothetical protein